MIATICCHEVAAGHCVHCGRSVLFVRRLALVSHRLHALLSLLTAGLWLIGWLLCCRRAAERTWECQECGCRTEEPCDKLMSQRPQAMRDRRLSAAELDGVVLPIVHELDL